MQLVPQLGSLASRSFAVWRRRSRPDFGQQSGAVSPNFGMPGKTWEKKEKNVWNFDTTVVFYILKSSFDSTPSKNRDQTIKAKRLGQWPGHGSEHGQASVFQLGLAVGLMNAVCGRLNGETNLFGRGVLANGFGYTQELWDNNFEG